MARERGKKTPATNRRKTPKRRRRESQARETGRPHAPPPAPGVITIRKYANRRLYDTASSAHITQEDLYRMVGRGAIVRVIDASTGEDITNQTLALALIEHDPAKLRLMPAWLLHQMIRLHEQALGGWLGPLWAMVGGTAASPSGAAAWPPSAGVPFAWPGGDAAWSAPAGAGLNFPWAAPAADSADAPSPVKVPSSAKGESEMAAMRAEVEALLERLGEIEAKARRGPRP